jgi:hypothetical protein
MIDMKNRYVISTASLILVLFAGLFVTSCNDGVLDQESTSEVPYSEFWKTDKDATYALMGCYNFVRGLFDRDYYFDGHSDMLRVRDGGGTMSTSAGNIAKGGAYQGGLYFPDPMWGFGARNDNYFKFCYGGVNRTNYVIENVKLMLDKASSESSRKELERVIGEARLLRGMIYMRLISMWGDVPYLNWVVKDNSEVAALPRTKIETIKDSCISDFTYAYEHLPAKASEIGRASKPAALAFRGKAYLYWASWNKNGWPELDGFEPSQEKAKEAYKLAAADFKHVIVDYGLNLFRNGEPGEVGDLGECNVLPNYFYLFIPSTANDNKDGENIFVFTHGGAGTSQSESLMRDFGCRSVGNSQAWVFPYYEVADHYQSTITGDYCDPLIPMNPSTQADARTAKNSALNPESYRNRDYRMKATLLWDYEHVTGIDNTGTVTGDVVFIQNQNNKKVTVNGVTYNTCRYDSNPYGFLFRKFLRNYSSGKRDEGNFNWPVMRLADVFLMYAEADNEVEGPQPYAINLVNRVRHRGNLPALAADKTSTKENFFKAIVQERFVELMAEGKRSFDLRRWRMVESAWGVSVGCAGVYVKDSHGANRQGWFINPTARDLERAYIFKIPQSEMDRNPKLTQNRPWL